MKEYRGGKRVYKRKPKSNEMEVPYDEWGQMEKLHQIESVADDETGYVRNVYEEDVIRYNQVEDIRPVTLKETIDEIKWYQNDPVKENGKTLYYYGDEDTRIYVTYADGSVYDSLDYTGKKIKKTGIIGVEISTGDFQQVAGYEIHKGQKVPLLTWEPEEGVAGRANVYSGYKSTEAWIERQQVTYERAGEGKRATQTRKTIRKSMRRAI